MIMENPGLILATIVGAFLVYIYFREKKEEKIALKVEQERTKQIFEEQKKEIEISEEASIPMTKDLAYRVLRGIGCEPKEMEDGRIVFEFQGVSFLMEVANECRFANIIWPWCYSFFKFDIEEFSRVRKVVNEINARSTSSVIYCFTDSDEVAVHIKKNFLLIPEIPDLENYLKSIFDVFFKTARTLDVELERVKMQE